MGLIEDSYISSYLFTPLLPPHSIFFSWMLVYIKHNI